MEFNFYLIKDFNNNLNFWKDIVIILGTSISTISILVSINKWKKQETWKDSKDTVIKIINCIVNINNTINKIQSDEILRIDNDNGMRQYHFTIIEDNLKENKLILINAINNLKTLLLLVSAFELEKLEVTCNKYKDLVIKFETLTESITQLKANPENNTLYTDFLYFFVKNDAFSQELKNILEKELTNLLNEYK